MSGTKRMEVQRWVQAGRRTPLAARSCDRRCRWHTWRMADVHTDDETTAAARNDVAQWLRVSYRALGLLATPWRRSA